VRVQEALPLHRTIVVVDVAGFTDPTRTLADQSDVHTSLYRIIRQAFVESGIDLGLCDIEDRGDGMMILLKPEVPKALLADRLPERLVAGLKRHNATRVASACFRLRVGFHSGEVLWNEHGAVSPALNFTFRIVEAQAAKLALRQSSEVLAIVASEHFYQEVIAADPAANPSRYRKISVSVKETQTAAWLLLPDSQVVQELLPAVERDELYEPLTSLTKEEVPQLLTLLRRAGGPATPPPTWCGNAWEAFRYLLDFNAAADGFPPALEFVRLLTLQVANPLRDLLTDWLTDQAKRMRLDAALRVRQQRASSSGNAGSRLHLLIMVEPAGIDGDRFLLSYWRQDDPAEWPPPRGETYEVDLADLERGVDELVMAAERAWSAHGGSAALEFLLPRSLLRLPVHRWSKDQASAQPRPLFMDYPIVLRSWDRMRKPELHRVWRERWMTMKTDPSPDRVHFSQPADLDKRNYVDAILVSPQWTIMVLTGPPPNMISAESDELMAALRAGLPAIIWHPHVSSDGLREFVTWLVEGDNMKDLPTRTRSSRLAAFQRGSDSFDTVDPAWDLVVLWDDPERTVLLDQPPVQPRP
jgi:class 3 adenylate cyclase